MGTTIGLLNLVLTAWLETIFYRRTYKKILFAKLWNAMPKMCET